MKINKKILFSAMCLIVACQLNATSLFDLLPDSLDIVPFAPSKEAQLFEKEQLFQYINGGADIYLEYGFHAVISQQYSHKQTTFVLDIYEMSDSQAAFGIHSIFRDPTKPPLNIGQEGAESDYQISFWQDKYYVILMGYDADEQTKMILKKAATLISNKLGTSRLPEITKELPKDFLVPRSIGTIEGLLALNRRLYLDRENILQIDGENVKAAFGSYKSDDDTAELIVVKMDNIAGAQKKVIEIFSKKYSPHPFKPVKIYKDQRNRYYAVKAGKNLIIIHKATSPNIIRKILAK